MLSAAALAAAAGPATALTQDGLTPAKGGTLKQEGVEGARPPSPFGEASREEEEEEEEEPELLFAPDLIISQVSAVSPSPGWLPRAWGCPFSYHDWYNIICAVQGQTSRGQRASGGAASSRLQCA